MNIGYFDSEGRVLLTDDGHLRMGPPPGTTHVAELPPEADANNIYYDDGVKMRQPMPLTITRNRISGIPAGTVARIKPDTFTVDDGVIEFDADVEETVRVSLDHPHYLYTAVMVEAGP